MRASRAAILVATVGLAVSLIWAVTALLDQVQRPAQFTRVAVPGQVQVVLTQPGTHVVYHEVAAGAGATPPLPAADVVVRDPNGAQVPVEEYRADLRYDHEGVLGTAVGEFSVPRTGTYVVSAADPADVGGTIAVGDDLAPGVVRALALPAATAAGALLLAALLALVPALARQPEPINAPSSASRGTP